MHPDDEQLQREESEVAALLRILDDSPPEISAATVVARAERAAASARRSAWLRRAAALLVAVGIAGAAYALPGWPVRGWVDGIVLRIGGRTPPSAETPAPPAPLGTEDSSAGVSGIAVRPGQKLLIRFQTAQLGGQVHVWLTDGPEVSVRAPAGAAIFASGAAQLLIDNRSPSATFEIRIPRDASWIEIGVGADRIFLKRGSRVTTGGSLGADGSYRLRLTPSGS